MALVMGRCTVCMTSKSIRIVVCEVFLLLLYCCCFFFLKNKTKTKKQNINKNLDWKNMEEKFNVSKWYLRSEGESSTVFYITVWKQNARENIYKLGAVPQLLAVKVLFPLQVT